jgi:hypothetical protein
MRVALKVKKIDGIEVASLRSGAMLVDVEMTGDQCKDAIIDLLKHDGEQAVFEWLKSAFPDWFEAAK